MDFYDPIVDEAAQQKKESTNDINERTETAVHKLEEEIDKTYTLIENRFKSILNDEQTAKGKAKLLSQLNSIRENVNVSQNLGSIEKQLASFSSNLSEGYSLEKLTTQLSSINAKSFDSSIKNISERISSFDIDSNLDSLDSKLEVVERKGGEYLSQVSNFFSTLVSVQSGNTGDSNSENEVTFSPISAYKVYGTSRFDNELFKLHTSESFYKEVETDFDVDSKTDVISDLLKKYPDTLDKLMNSLVPVTVSYKSFWACYFDQLAKTEEAEKKRKQLLENDNDEEFTWDDEEDTTPATKTESAKSKGVDAEESDDDWE